MGWASRLHAEQLSATWFARAPRGRQTAKVRSNAMRQWVSPLTPGAALVMTDRIYGILKNGSIFRLPVGTAKNVKSIT